MSDRRFKENMTSSQRKAHRNQLQLVRPKAIKTRINNWRKTFWKRFWGKVAKNGENGCWNWLGSLNGSGYGQSKKAGRAEMVHRLSYEFHKRAFDKALQVLHHCDNPKCVNPDHLFLGTPQDNVTDCINKNRRRYRRGETHHNAKLTDDEVKVIRRIYPQYAKLAKVGELAKRFGVHKQSLYNIYCRKRRS